jgi:hypothetical protein
MKKLNSKQILQELKATNDGDNWGWAMSVAFPLCEILYLRDEHDIPELMRFRPGMGGVNLEEDCHVTEILKDQETCDLEQIGRVLNRYMEILKQKGEDY